MKNKSFKILLVSFITILKASSFAFAGSDSQNAVDTSGKNSLLVLLGRYYELKDALVADDANSAAAKSASFLSILNTIDEQSLSQTQKKLFASLQPKLSYDSRHISEVVSIDHQREHFASLSTNMMKLVKEARISSDPVYKMYCPMKKAYWLSNGSMIANPYYGKQMISCGEISEVIK